MCVYISVKARWTCLLQLYKAVRARVLGQIELIFLLHVIGKEASDEEVLSREAGRTPLRNREGDEDLGINPVGAGLVRIPAFNREAAVEQEVSM